jgi:hypothetical protein
MTDHIHATGATMSSGQREQGMHALRGRRHAGLVRLMVLRQMCWAALPDGRCARGSMHGYQGVECAWTQRVGAAWGPCHAGLPPAFRTVSRPGLASNGSGFCVRYCTTVLQPPMQTLGFKWSHSISRHPFNASGCAYVPRPLFEP